jgi:diguanylate cyclase (GGDEF)-like protein
VTPNSAAPVLTDPLTGLLNADGLREAYDRLDGRRALVVAGVDGFETISGRWGWATADRVAAKVGRVLVSRAGQAEIPARLGAGDFAVLLPGLDLEAASIMAQTLLTTLRMLCVDDPAGETLRLTASLGAVGLGAKVPFDAGLDVAHRRLMRAREEGGNRLVVDEEAPVVTDTTTRIIVADDDEIAAKVLTHRLGKEGLEVVRYDNGKSAFEAVIQAVPDLLILDVKMPGMDGFEVVERLRKVSACRALPIILLTSMGNEADIVRGFELGADDYVLKPFSPVELVARVRRFLNRRPPPSSA